MGTEPPVAVIDDLASSDLRPYRLPFLERFAEAGGASMTVWHGNSPRGIGAPQLELGDLPVEDRRVRNIFWPGGQHRVIWQRGAMRVLRSESNVIVCAEVVHNLTIWLIALFHRFFGKRLVLRGYFYRPGRQSRVKGLARRLLHRLADTYIAYSERGRTSLLTEGVPADRVFVSQNTLDTEALQELAKEVDREEVEELRARLGHAGERVLLYVGKLIPPKRVDTAIAALRMIDDASLIVVGDGYMRDDLERDAADLPVRFVGAIYDEPELAVYFGLADLLLLPGRVGLTCVHGFANGVPCVTTVETAVEQSPEYDYIADGYNGLILPDARPETHASAIRRLLEDHSRLERLRAGARETATQLSMDVMVREYERAVSRALIS